MGVRNLLFIDYVKRRNGSREQTRCERWLRSFMNTTRPPSDLASLALSNHLHRSEFDLEGPPEYQYANEHYFVGYGTS